MNVPAVSKVDGSDRRVVLDSLPPKELVTRADSLLAAGAAVLIDPSELSTLDRALASWIDGRRWVRLSPRSPRWYRTTARIRDSICALLGLIVLCPLIALLALLVKITSSGPAFFSAQVIGEAGRPFVWRKLRTMRLGSAEDEEARRARFGLFMSFSPETGPSSGAPFKVLDESRVTPVGGFLRRHSLDELPQLWNVLRGEMSLVGPRPCLPYEYDMQEPWHRLRYRVRPGLTGPWQVFGRSRVTFDQMALIDYCYAWSRSFWLDFRLILRTVVVMATGDGGK